MRKGRSLTAGAVWALAGGLGVLAALGGCRGSVPATPLRWAMGEMAQLFVDGQNVVPARLQQQGFAFKYPTLEQALRDLV